MKHDHANIDGILRDATQRMDKSLQTLHRNFKKIRTGRPHPDLLDAVSIDYYGTPTPLPQAAGISVEDGRCLVVAPWDKALLPDIEKAIMNADLGLNPNTSNDVVRINMPPLTEETRRDYTRQARQVAEVSKVAMRNIRREANSAMKSLVKQHEVGEDEERKGEEQIQDLTNKNIGEIDKALAVKEQELMAQ